MDVEKRVAAGNKVNGALVALMRRRNVSTAARLLPYTMPTLLYGSETWVYRRRMKER